MSSSKHVMSSKHSYLDRLIIYASWASVCVAMLLLLLKLYAWFMTGSMGVLAALVDSLLDLVASLINMFAVRYALVPADDEHRFGHGKAEALAGLGQATFIASSALFLIVFTIERIVHPELIESVDVGSTVIAISMALTLCLVAFQKHVVKKTGSVAIRADSLHYSADLVSNAGILLGLILYYWGWLYSDPVIALLIGFYILKCAFDVGNDSVQLLLDHGLSEEEQSKIMAIACSHADVIEVHDLRTRQSGRTKFIQMHLVMNGEMSLTDAHILSDAVEQGLISAFEDVDVLIHQDPHTELS